MKTIVTHQNPDLDAILSVWLLQRYGGLDQAQVIFVNTGNPDQAVLDKAAAVVDTGKEYDPARLRFDHHQLPGLKANDTCAAMMVFKHLTHQENGQDIWHLQPLVDLVFAGDTGRKTFGAEHSRLVGLHAILSGLRARHKDRNGYFAPDNEVMGAAFTLLDALDTHLKNRSLALADLEKKLVYRSDDGVLIAIKHGSTATSFAAFDEGTELVIFEGEPILDAEGNIISYPIGIQRKPELNEPHCGELVKAAIGLAVHESPYIAEELESWYRHEAGFFSGRGTGKAPDPRPIKVDLIKLARLIDRVYPIK